MAAADVMTQQHQVFYELVTSDGRIWGRTTSRKKAAGWHAENQRAPDDADGLRIQVSMDVWYSSPRADQHALARRELELDRRYGL
jgi:hypothetical protein